jgi:transcriptional regulator with XRE-family HTH domain
MTINRSRRARESAGLSLGQAARLLGVNVDQLRQVEENDAAYADTDPARLADLYGVNVDWLSGRGELRDYALLKEISDGDRLTFRDRDMLAELYASWPRARRIAR